MKISRENKTKLNITFSMVALALIALVTATFAWFTLSLSTKVNTIDMEVTAGSYLKIDTVDRGNDLDAYKTEVDNAMINAQMRSGLGYTLDDVKLAPLTSADGVFLYDQQRKPVDNKRKSFVEFDLYFIGSTAMDVYLTEENSKVGEDDGTHVSTKETGAKAKVVECARISFEPEGQEGQIYEPKKNNATTLTVLGAGTQKTFTEAATGNNDARLFSLEAERVKKVTVRVWIEGDDEPDCNDDVIKATFAARLRFEGVEQ